MATYYHGLSSDNSSDESSDDGSDVESLHETVRPSEMRILVKNSTSTSSVICGSDGARFILHMDVDCFYCQCESLDRNIPLDRPLAIGQKQIVVTSNYAARSYGVGKLQMRDQAQQRCRHLMIVEGSDLERYRIHSRKIYQTLRRVCQELHPNVAVCKGSMDEATVDLTAAVVAWEGSGRQEPPDLKSIYIYDVDSEPVGRGYQSGSSKETSTMAENLQYAAYLGIQVRDAIFRETGFTTTLGVSSNPMLSKLASGLRKPGTINVVYPWKSDCLLRATSLGSIPGFGRRTVAALVPCLRHAFPERLNDCQWTCRDLKQIPVQRLEGALNEVPALSKSSSDLARSIYNKCRGTDDTQVVDDGGRPSHTVSVENSFRRGTVLTVDAIKAGMQDLYHRLPRLLQHRWSIATDYPKTLRLTVRYVDREGSPVATHRRPFVTKSQQTAIQGKQLYTAPTVASQGAMLQSMVMPLLRSMFLCIKLDVTRINVALADFQPLLSAPKEVLRSVAAQGSTMIPEPNDTERSHFAAATPSKRPLLRNEETVYHDSCDDANVQPPVVSESNTDIAGGIGKSIPTRKASKRSRIDHFFTPRRRKAAP